MTTKCTEIFDELMKPEVAHIKVKKHDGQIEKFDPITLIESLVESEMDLRSSFLIFDSVIEKISKIKNRNEFSHDEIQYYVSNSILENANNIRNGLVCFTNYSNLFGLDEDTVTESDYITVRNASELRWNILKILTEITEKGTVKCLEKYFGSQELSTITNRLIKVIRYCGFYKVEKNFLKKLCLELAERSSKGILPKLISDGNQIQQDLEKAEDYIILATQRSSHEDSSCLMFLNLALEHIGCAFLEKFGLLAVTASRQSFNQFLNILRPISYNQSVKKDYWLPSQSIKENIITAFKERGLPINRFYNDCSELLNAIENKQFKRACGEAKSLLLNFEVILAENREYTELLSYCIQDDLKGYVNNARLVLNRHGLNCNFEDSEGRVLTLKIDHSYHDLIKFGRRVIFNFLFFEHPNQFLEESSFTLFEDDFSKYDDCISIIVTTADLDVTYKKKLDNLADRFCRCPCVLSRDQFEKALKKPDIIRDEILRQIGMLIPSTQTWDEEIFGSNKINISAAIKNYEAGILKEINAQIQRGKYSDSCVNLSKMLEFVFKEYCLFLCAVIRSGIRDKNVVITIQTEPYEYNLNMLIKWLDQLIFDVYSNRKLRNILQKLLIKKESIELLHDARLKRNDYMHFNREILAEEAEVYFRQIIGLIQQIHQAMSLFTRAIYYKTSTNYYIFRSYDKCEFLSKDKMKLDNFHLENGCCVYICEHEHFHQVIHALTICDRWNCRKITHLDSCMESGYCCCKLCGADNIKLQVSWHRIVKRLKKEVQLYREKQDRKKIIQ